MYIEGDDSGTKFIVEKNTFINNVIKNQGDQNANRKGDFVFIHSNKKVKFNNSFSERKLKRLKYVDHYKNERSTNLFSYSHVFSQSNDLRSLNNLVNLMTFRNQINL